MRIDCNYVYVYTSIYIADRPEPPQSLFAAEITSNAIYLTWLKPHDNNAPILGYYITFIGAGLGEKVVVNTSKESADFCSLWSDANYTFNITAFNELGVSDPSDSLTVWTLRAVGEYTLLLSIAQLLITV